jgi:hypothetical protein
MPNRFGWKHISEAIWQLAGPNYWVPRRGERSCRVAGATQPSIGFIEEQLDRRKLKPKQDDVPASSGLKGSFASTVVPNQLRIEFPQGNKVLTFLRNWRNPPRTLCWQAPTCS